MITGQQIRRIRRRIKYRGQPIGQKRFGRLLRTTQVSVCRWERGHFTPIGPVETLLRLLDGNEIVLHGLQKLNGFPSRHERYKFGGRS